MRFIDNFQVQNNIITGSIPAHIFGKLTHLRTLNMQQNKFRGRMPTQIGICCKLEELRLTTTLQRKRFPYRVGRTLDTADSTHLQQQGWRAYPNGDWWNGKLKRTPRPKQSVGLPSDRDGEKCAVENLPRVQQDQRKLRALV
jgi:hypothetical protein